MEKKYITSEELLTHNKPEDLWISIQGKIYNVTDWAKIHPGGDVLIFNLAGQDVTDAFIAYHPGTAWKHLDNLFTGFHLEDYKVTEVSRDFRKLATEFSKLGLFEKKAHVASGALTTVGLMFMAVVYGVVMCDSVLIHIISAALLGLLWILAAYVGHDSGHYTVMIDRKCNKLAQFLSGNSLTGISIAWWKWTHNAHHIACNSLDYDPDLQHMPVFAVSSRFFDSITSVFYSRKLEFDRVARFMISYQHFTFYPVMCVGRINLFIQTFLLLFSKRRVPDRAVNILGIFVFWIWFPLLVSYIPSWPERFMFVLISFSVTALQHVQFCLNHFAANVYLGPPHGNDWFEKQTSGTIDISCSSYMDWIFGGLQFQLEHHLFPRMPRTQLRKIAPVVRELCKKHNLPYRSLTWWEANVWTIRTLRTAAYQARDLTNASPKNLLWEAMNTHG
jgi:delta8-fatty-acid desaturase